MLTFKRRQVGDRNYYCILKYCVNIPKEEVYVECLLANCPDAIIKKEDRDVSDVAEPAVDRLPSSSTAAYCVRFLCGNQHLTNRMSCVQLACLGHPLTDGYGAYQYGYPGEVDEEDMLQEVSSVCRRLLCFHSNAATSRMGDLLQADGVHVSVARRKTSATSAQYESSNCGDFCSNKYSGVWNRRWCIVRCYKRLKL